MHNTNSAEKNEDYLASEYLLSRVLLFNFMLFPRPHKTRKGSDIDLKNLKSTAFDGIDHDMHSYRYM